MVDLQALAPLLAQAATVVALLLAATFSRARLLPSVLACAGLATSAVLAARGARPLGAAVPLLALDHTTYFFLVLIAGAAFFVALLAHGYMRAALERPHELQLLVVIATLGASVLAASTHFAALFLALEVLSVSLYGLIAYPRRGKRLEAALKYLVLGGASSAFLLFGLGLVYAEQGTLELTGMKSGPSGVVWAAGVALIITGVGFKLAVAPFHMWTPDVYEGAPTPITAFVATVSKGAMLALLLRWYLDAGGPGNASLARALTVLAIASMLVGNLLALLQSNIKRLLAYSSIAQLGYLLVPLIAGSRLAVEGIGFYVAGYFLTTLLAFGVLTALSTPETEVERLDELRGLAWRRPWLAAAFTAALLSLASIPLTAGFVGKIYLFGAAVDASLWWLTGVLVAGSVIALFYYLRVIFALYEHVAPDALTSQRVGPEAALALGLLALGLVWLGAHPDPLMQTLRTMSFGPP